MTGFRRQVIFRPGYNHSEEQGPYARGVHGMGIVFVLMGPDGAASFAMNTGWVPPKPGAVGRFGGPAVVHRTGADDLFPMGEDLGYHWERPLLENHAEWSYRTDCPWTPSGVCYYDGSGLAAEDVLAEFIVKGSPAVWRWLVRRYRWCLEQEAEFRAATT